MSDVFHDEEMALLEQQALFGKREVQMEINGVKIRDSFGNISALLAEYFGFTFYGTSHEVYLKNEFEKKYNLFGLFHGTTRKVEYCKLGFFADDWSKFYVIRQENIPLVVPFIKKFSEESKQRCDIVICGGCGGFGPVINYNMDAPQFLSARRQYLEQKLRTIESERENIEKDLSDVHKKLQALEGGGGPYRALSAVE